MGHSNEADAGNFVIAAPTQVDPAGLGVVFEADELHLAIGHSVDAFYDLLAAGENRVCISDHDKLLVGLQRLDELLFILRRIIDQPPTECFGKSGLSRSREADDDDRFRHFASR